MKVVMEPSTTSSTIHHPLSPKRGPNEVYLRVIHSLFEPHFGMARRNICPLLLKYIVIIIVLLLRLLLLS